MQRQWTSRATAAALSLGLAQASAFQGPDPPDLREQVNAAIDRGVAHLIDTQSIEGRWKWSGGANERRSGPTALGVYALIKSGVNKRHPAVLRGIAALDDRSAPPTYDAACVLMALCAHDFAGHQARIQTLVDQLVEQQSNGIWGYPGGGDLSNTQYAAMGLWAARRKGAEVPVTVWKELAGAMPRFAANGGGFGYSPSSKRASTETMTVAGIACVEICRDFLGDELSGRKTKRSTKLDRDQEKALSWIARRFPTQFKSRGSLGYYLYGLERMGALTGLRELDGKNWYEIGARFLVEQQDKNGAWKQLYAGSLGTSFALLFLSRATSTAPVSGPTSIKKKGAASSLEPATPWLTELARAYVRNEVVAIIASPKSSLKASSSEPSHVARMATDGLRTTYWRCLDQDDDPTLELRFGSSIVADTIAIGHAYDPAAERGAMGRALEVQVSINGKKPQAVRMFSDPLHCGRLELPRPTRIHSLKLSFPRRIPGDKGRRGIGISEVEVYERR